MEPLYYVMFAGMIVWLIIGLYIFALGTKQNALAIRVARLETLQEGNDDRA